MAIDRSQVQPGMPVLGSDGQEIGRVKAVRERDSLVDRPLDRDVCVLFAAIKEFLDSRIVLHITSLQVADQGWLSPPLLDGASRSASSDVDA